MTTASRSLRNLGTMLAAFVAASSFLFLLPGPGGVSIAEGCSGGSQSPSCTKPGWHDVTLHESAQQVPPNAGVILLGEADSMGCPGSGPDLSLSAVAVDSAGNQVSGSIISLSLLDYVSPTLRPFLWTPDSPLTPGASYTLQVSSVVQSGAAGAGSAGAGGAPEFSLAFAVSSSPLMIQAPVVTGETVVANESEYVCCGGCGAGPCYPITDKPGRQLKVNIAPADAGRVYFVDTVLPCSPDGTLLDEVSSSFSGLASSGPVQYSTWPPRSAEEPLDCLIVKRGRLGSTEERWSPVFCAEPLPLGPKVVRCDSLAQFENDCSSPFYHQAILPEIKLQCAAGAGGSTGVPASGDKGGTANGSGNIAGAPPASASPSASSGASDAPASEGCSLASPVPAGGGSLAGLWAATLALVALGRRRR